MSFGDQIKGFRDRVKTQQTTVFRKVGLEMFSRVILRTPVDTGRLRGNWQASVGEQAEGELERLDPQGSEAQAEAARVVLGAETDKALYLTNNLPYARRIEYEGWSKQAPAGMVRVTAAEFEGVVKTAVEGGE